MTSDDGQPMASDKLAEIREWLGGMQEELDDESISYGELNEIDSVYDLIKVREEQIV